MKKKEIRVNEQITSSHVRVIGSDGNQIGIMKTAEANRLALAAGLDLVEIVPTADPPVCKIMDYGKYRYEQSKKEKIQKRKQHTIQVKEIRLSPKIEQHDIEFKIKHARKFIEQGDKVKINIIFKGRQIAHKEFGEQVISRVIQELADVAKPDGEPQFEGRNIVVFLIKK